MSWFKDCGAWRDWPGNSPGRYDLSSSSVPRSSFAVDINDRSSFPKEIRKCRWSLLLCLVSLCLYFMFWRRKSSQSEREIIFPAANKLCMPKRLFSEMFFFSQKSCDSKKSIWQTLMDNCEKWEIKWGLESFIYFKFKIGLVSASLKLNFHQLQISFFVPKAIVVWTERKGSFQRPFAQCKWERNSTGPQGLMREGWWVDSDAETLS